MAQRHTIGTPTGGASKQRRVNSPYPAGGADLFGESPMQEKIAELKKVREALQTPASASNAAAPTADVTHKLLDAIETLSQKMDRMALKSDLGNLQSKLEASTKAAVSEIVAPIKTDVADLQHNVHQLMNRMTAVEQKPVVQGSTQISAELFSLLDRADPAHKQIALLGFSDIAPADHIQHIEALLAKFPAFKACDYGTFYSGPRNNRKPTQNCYVEFPTASIAGSFLEAAKSHTMVANGKNIRIKKTNTKIILQRNWSLKEAHKLVLQSGVPGAAAAKLDWQERVIKIGDDIVFKQSKFELKGSFLGVASHLALP